MHELLRRLAERVVNAVMDADADQLWGGRGEQPQRPPRTKPRCMRGHAYTAHPKLSIGSFFPEDELERYQRVGRALVDAVAEMYATGEFFS